MRLKNKGFLIIISIITTVPQGSTDLIQCRSGVDKHSKRPRSKTMVDCKRRI